MEKYGKIHTGKYGPEYSEFGYAVDSSVNE